MTPRNLTGEKATIGVSLSEIEMFTRSKLDLEKIASLVFMGVTERPNERRYAER